jgi:hypothetical protein
MIDPSTADVTARVVECLGRFGWPGDHPVIQKAIQFLMKDQSRDGAWFGRWGVNYVYGTSGVLRALETVSYDGAGLLRAGSGLAAAGAEGRTAALANRCAAMTNGVIPRARGPAHPRRPRGA